MKRKKLLRDINSLTISGVALGVGANVVGQADVTGSVPGASQAFGKVAGFMPVVGTLMGAGMAMNAMKGLSPKKAKRRRRR